MAGNLLEVRNLKKYYSVKSGFLNKDRRSVKAVDGINLSVKQGEILGIVGESGCGKSTLGRSILRLIEPTSGEVIFEGTNICGLKKEEMRLKRREMQIVFQDPGASLNPRLTVGEIIGEPLEVFHICEGKEKEERIYKLMDLVGINRAYINRFPHEFSGGQRQRLGIARALAVNPKLIICDEPVSALDVSIRAQVLNLIKELKDKLNLTYIFISHDLSVVHHICDRVAVMYLGRVVEIADKKQIYENPVHPYTKALLSAIPMPDPEVKRERIILQGDVPNPADPPSGCHFHKRCPYAKKECSETVPPFVTVEPGHQVLCWLAEEQQSETKHEEK
ncbi:dipeptide ABC transporter ATP-binding protein [Clostridium sp. AF37-5AT]|uniref:ABC transporter ATP-binding protein n=1 Tax=Eubacteriales TaxID=186802 RepID=UPI000E3F0C89|nr:MULTISPECIES: dipeptide ABC transporter ATP-binding protein [Eubacteriales]RGD98997.1 dipeptide ABC transporter ATP-binding protein [Clostridium sp. AF28-12]RGE12943.1 dipeptide ABC transporter ATP-binding protein [Clostridiaceae bacterium TF01-6]RGE14141.1 dipeptide ABC transporter ATP-binding protein [Desulfotomaculum sp. OF05-3]RHO96354.1 dipeptide ABC transporter ATP-binding protein [Clostridium sp. AF37-5AT]